MKPQLLSILSDVSGATESGSASESTSTSTAETQSGFSSYRTRYQEFLSRQSSTSQQKSYRTASPIRFLQGMFSFAVFVAMFLAILTLVGFGLSSLGVIAQVSPTSRFATNNQNPEVKKDSAKSPSTTKRPQRK